MVQGRDIRDGEDRATKARRTGGSGGSGNGEVSSSESAVIDKVREAIASVEYGSVLIKIHQGEVVGIETSTKVRLKGPDPLGA